MPPVCAQALDQGLHCRRAFDVAVRDRVVDARQILHHQPARADVEMSDLGIPHLPRGQTDLLARRAQEGVWTACPQPVERGRVRLPDGVVGRIVAPAPAVEHDQHHRTTLLHLDLPCVLRGPGKPPTLHRSGGLCGIAASSSTSRTAADRSRRFRRWSLADRACLSCHTTTNSARAAGGCCGTLINPMPRIR